MDTIDRELAIEWIYNWRDKNKYYHPLSKNKTIPISEVIDILEGVPSAEKTELVRCKDCKHWNGETHGCTRNPSVEPWFESDYCNYGARMVE